MTVKELIEKLKEHDQNMRVVVDTIEGPYDIYEYVSNGGLGQPTYEPVVWITLDERVNVKKNL